MYRDNPYEVQIVKITFDPSKLPDISKHFQSWAQLRTVLEGEGFIIVAGYRHVMESALGAMAFHVRRITGMVNTEAYRVEFIDDSRLNLTRIKRFYEKFPRKQPTNSNEALLSAISYAIDA